MGFLQSLIDLNGLKSLNDTVSDPNNNTIDTQDIVTPKKSRYLNQVLQQVQTKQSSINLLSPQTKPNSQSVSFLPFINTKSQQIVSPKNKQISPINQLSSPLLQQERTAFNRQLGKKPTLEQRQQLNAQNFINQIIVEKQQKQVEKQVSKKQKWNLNSLKFLIQKSVLESLGNINRQVYVEATQKKRSPTFEDDQVQRRKLLPGLRMVQFDSKIINDQEYQSQILVNQLKIIKEKLASFKSTMSHCKDIQKSFELMTYATQKNYNLRLECIMINIVKLVQNLFKNQVFDKEHKQKLFPKNPIQKNQPADFEMNIFKQNIKLFKKVDNYFNEIYDMFLTLNQSNYWTPLNFKQCYKCLQFLSKIRYDTCVSIELLLIQDQEYEKSQRKFKEIVNSQSQGNMINLNKHSLDQKKKLDIFTPKFLKDVKEEPTRECKVTFDSSIMDEISKLYQDEFDFSQGDYFCQEAIEQRQMQRKKNLKDVPQIQRALHIARSVGILTTEIQEQLDM